MAAVFDLSSHDYLETNYDDAKEDIADYLVEVFSCMSNADNTEDQFSLIGEYKFSLPLLGPRLYYVKGGH